MNKSAKEYRDYIVDDVMRDIPGIESKGMFGGFGIYKDGKIFAIITDDSELFFKVDENLSRKFEKHGSHPFVYKGHKTKKPITMPYWLLPEEIMEDREELQKWIDASAAVSKKK